MQNDKRAKEINKIFKKLNLEPFSQPNQDKDSFKDEGKNTIFSFLITNKTNE